MPVIAISVSKKVYDYYHSLRSGERSKRFRNILERHLRLEDTYGMERNTFNDLKLENQTLRDNIEKLQQVITRLSEEPKKVSLLNLIRRFLKGSPKEMPPGSSEQE